MLTLYAIAAVCVLLITQLTLCLLLVYAYLCTSHIQSYYLFLLSNSLIFKPGMDGLLIVLSEVKLINCMALLVFFTANRSSYRCLLRVVAVGSCVASVNE